MSRPRNKPALRHYLAFAVMFAAFGACMWWIFSPSASERQAAEAQAGFNASIPDPERAGIVSDKKTAYEEEQQRLRQEEKMRTLEEYAFSLGREEQIEAEAIPDTQTLVHLIMRSIHKENRRYVKHIGGKSFGIQYLVRGLYTHNGLLYLHTQIRNGSNVPYDVDFITFKIVDRKVAKRTAIQEQIILPVRAYNYATRVAGGKDERTVFAFEKFTIPDDKQLVVELHEKSGGRHQRLIIRNDDIVQARVIDELKIQ